MKKTKLILYGIGFLLPILSPCQVTNLNNTWSAGAFLGWNAGIPPNPLSIRNDFNQPINFSTNLLQRMNLRPSNNLNLITYPNGNNTGYLAFGAPTFNSPLWHLSIESPAYSGFGELLLGATVSDVPRSYGGMMNPATANGTFNPTFYGHLDSSQAGPAISIVGNIDPVKDIAPGVGGNNFPVERFLVAKGIRLHNSGASNISEIIDRVAFTYQNDVIIKMMMTAQGRVGIGESLSIPGTLPNNRIEITGSANNAPYSNDPYFGTPNGCSGLRLTNMTSSNTPLPPGTNSVNVANALTVDGNGDVVLVTPPISTVASANNGLSVTNNTLIQLGATCGSPSVALGALQNDRSIELNGYNLIFSEQAAGIGSVGIGKGIGCTPGNRLEVNNGTTNATISGLRLTDLAGGTPGPPTNTVLSINALGDVILSSLPTPTGSFPGNYCGSPLSSLTGSFQLDLNNSKLGFTAPNLSPSSQVLIGLPACSIWNSRLSVWDDVNGEGVYGYSSRNPAAGAGNHIGVHGNGIDGGVSFGTSNIGVLGEGDNIYSSQGYAGVAGYAGPPVLTSLPLGEPIGVYGNSGTSGMGWAGWFDGNTTTTQTLSAYSFNIISDKRFKKDINKIEDANEKLRQLSGYTYKFDTENYKERKFDKGEQIGLLAQDLKDVLPQLVREDKDGYLRANYAGVIPVLLEAIKANQNTIKELKSRVENCKQRINSAIPAGNSNRSKK